jgi:hypothetical protein
MIWVTKRDESPRGCDGEMHRFGARVLLNPTVEICCFGSSRESFEEVVVEEGGFDEAEMAPLL